MRTEADRLVKDLKNAACDAEDLIKATAGELNKKGRQARLRIKASLNSAKQSCETLEQRAREGAKVTDRQIRSYPYESIGVAFAIGLLLGILAGRRS